MKDRACKICKKKFTPRIPLQPTCEDMDCQYAYAMQHLNKKKKEKVKEDGRAKKEFRENDRKFLLELAQKTFNTFIRIRDGKYCISCGYKGDGRQFHAGHFKSQGGNSALRFDESNCNSQCSICNNHLSGNLVKYRASLISKIGIEEVERLETSKNTKLWTIDELKEIIAKYKQKIKESKMY